MSNEAMKLALEAFKAPSPMGNYKAIKALEESLAKQCTYPDCDYPCTNLPDCQEQKPVKWSDYESDGVHHNKPSLAKQEQGEPVYCQLRHVDTVGNASPWGTPLDAKERHSKWAAGIEMRLLYTTPQQRTWVGLKSEDYNEIFEKARTGEHAVQLAEAKLKDLNA
jgi:hypothetical protein